MTAATELQDEAIRTIWYEPMLEPEDAVAALGARPTHRMKLRRLREGSSLLGLAHGNRYLYPAFQFELKKRDVFPEVQTVNERLKAGLDPWGVASWWVSYNARLGERPADLVGTDRANHLTAVAEAVAEPLG